MRVNDLLGSFRLLSVEVIDARARARTDEVDQHGNR